MGYCVECGDKAVALGLCARHYMRQRRAGEGRTPKERELMRVDRGTGDTGKHKKPSALQRGAIAAALERDAEAEERVVRMPYVRFLDPEHQKVKT